MPLYVIDIQCLTAYVILTSLASTPFFSVSMNEIDRTSIKNIYIIDASFEKPDRVWL